MIVTHSHDLYNWVTVMNNPVLQQQRQNCTYTLETAKIISVGLSYLIIKYVGLYYRTVIIDKL